MDKHNSEADKIYKFISNRQIPKVIIPHFENLSKKIEARFSDLEVKTYYEYIEKVQDLEALELAARHLKRLPILTIKFKIMLYLAETLPENYPKFISEKNNCFSGYLLLTASVIRSVYKLIKGFFLLTAYKS